MENYAQLRGALPPADPPKSMPAREQDAGAKEEAIRRELGVAPTAYYQLLSQLIDDPAAIAYDPMLVKRLQRQRASRHRQRTRDRLSPHPSGGS